MGSHVQCSRQSSSSSRLSHPTPHPAYLSSLRFVGLEDGVSTAFSEINDRTNKRSGCMHASTLHLVWFRAEVRDRWRKWFGELSPSGRGKACAWIAPISASHLAAAPAPEAGEHTRAKGDAFICAHFAENHLACERGSVEGTAERTVEGEARRGRGAVPRGNSGGALCMHV